MSRRPVLGSKTAYGVSIRHFHTVTDRLLARIKSLESDARKLKRELEQLSGHKALVEWDNENLGQG